MAGSRKTRLNYSGNMVSWLLSRRRLNGAIQILISSAGLTARKLHKAVRRMPESKPVRFGIIGCGTASIPVCEAITSSPFAELISVYDVNEDLASDLGQRFQVQAVKTLEELLGNPAVEAVYVAVPHFLLATLARQGLEAGKHVLAEKPLAISLEDVDCQI